MAQLIKNLPAMWKMWVCSGLGRSPGEGKGYSLQNQTGFVLGACKKVLSTTGVSLSGQEHKDYMNMISIHLRWVLLISIIMDEETEIQRG